MITVLLVRHADIEIPPPAGDPDPSLTLKGQARAEELARVARGAGVTTIFTSTWRRTRQTAAPLASMLSLTPTVVPDAATFAAGVKAGSYGPAILVVGHSDTVPQMIDALLSLTTGLTIREFDNLFVVSIASSESQLLRLKYGAS